MKTVIFIYFMLLCLNLYSQSLTLSDLERIDTFSTSSARVSFITSKGFTFSSNNSYNNDSGTVLHRIVYTKGTLTIHDSTFSRETISWISEMTTKEFSYKTPDETFYNNIIRQIRPKYPSGTETAGANGEVFIKYKRNNKNITGVLSKRRYEDGTSSMLYDLQFSSN